MAGYADNVDVFLQRRFEENGLDYNDQTLGFGAGPYALVSVQLGPIRLALEASGGMLFFANSKNTLIPYVTGGALVALGL